MHYNFAGGAYTNVGTAAAYFAYDTVNQFDPASILIREADDAFMGTTDTRQVDFVPTFFSITNTVKAISSGADLSNTNLGFTIDNSLANFIRLTYYYDIVNI
jgi:hypothetical protein